MLLVGGLHDPPERGPCILCVLRPNLTVKAVLTPSPVKTDQFHAMYRVLEAFSLLNAILGASAGLYVACAPP